MFKIPIIIFIVVSGLLGDAVVLFGGHGQMSSHKIKSWREMRDQNLIHQNIDYSCGAASIATILTYYYNHEVSEKQILMDINKWGGASFADIQRILPKYSFKGLGLGLSFDKLRKIQIPAIVYLKHKGQDHFSVLKGINDTHVFLADPSWGNISFRHYRFKEMWETRGDEKADGKILLIMPEKMADSNTTETFFSTKNINYFDTEMLLFRKSHMNIINPIDAVRRPGFSW